jgi:hypothetical protein
MCLLTVFDYQPANFVFLALYDGIQDRLVFGPGVRAALFSDGCEVPMNLLDDAVEDVDKHRVSRGSGQPLMESCIQGDKGTTATSAFYSLMTPFNNLSKSADLRFCDPFRRNTCRPLLYPPPNFKNVTDLLECCVPYVGS